MKYFLLLFPSVPNCEFIGSIFHCTNLVCSLTISFQFLSVLIKWSKINFWGLQLISFLNKYIIILHISEDINCTWSKVLPYLTCQLSLGVSSICHIHASFLCWNLGFIFIYLCLRVLVSLPVNVTSITAAGLCW